MIQGFLRTNLANPQVRANIFSLAPSFGLHTIAVADKLTDCLHSCHNCEHQMYLRLTAPATTHLCLIYQFWAPRDSFFSWYL